MLEMTVPAKYQHDIDHLVRGFHGLHGLHHRIAWAIMPQCIRDLAITGLMVANHPYETMNAILDMKLNELADQDDEEARQ